MKTPGISKLGAPLSPAPSDHAGAFDALRPSLLIQAGVLGKAIRIS